DGPTGTKQVLRFTQPAGQVGPIQAVFEWDENQQDTGYVLETEKNKPGSYYFPFHNVLGAPAELELAKPDCDCTEVGFSLLPTDRWQKVSDILAKAPWKDPFKDEAQPEWNMFTNNDRRGFPIPTGGLGVVRVSWKARK